MQLATVSLYLPVPKLPGSLPPCPASKTIVNAASGREKVVGGSITKAEIRNKRKTRFIIILIKI